MRKIQSYRDLRVWQMGMNLAENCYRITQIFPQKERYGLTSQIRRAAVSIPANIAEGYGTGQCEVFQKISFLYELKPLQALTYTTCKPGPDENHSQTLKPLSDGHSLKNFALSSMVENIGKNMFSF